MKVEAVLMELNIRMFNNTREDQQLSDEFKLSKSIGQKSGKWVKNKLSPEFLIPVTKWNSGTRSAHYLLTLPYTKGMAILPLSAMDAYNQIMNGQLKKLETIKENMGQGYDLALAEAKAIHRDTFNENDYPPLADFLENFGLKWTPYPFPAADAFTKTLAGEALATASKKLEFENASKLELAKKEMWQRVMEPLTKMAQTLSSPDAIFRDSLVFNLQHVIKVAPHLNIDKDPEFAKTIAKIDEMVTAIDPEKLRDDKVLRKEVAGIAGELASQFGGLGSRKIIMAE